MATAIGSLLTNELVLKVQDSAAEPGVVRIALDGATSDANIISIVDDYIAETNALVEPSLVRTYPFTGYATSGRPISALQNLIASILAIDFQKANPLNAAKTVSKQVPLVAYLEAIRNDAVFPHVPVTTDATLNALIALLEAKLDYVGADGAHYPGGWTFNPSSKFGTKLTVTDGF